MTVTVCIAAYGAAEFIPATLRSVSKQNNGDIKVLVAVDPSEAGATHTTQDTLDAIRPFLADSRFKQYVNAKRLGWADNIRECLKQVDTEFYAILPHDDLWHPGYVETLLRRLKANPQAVVAYADFLSFDHGRPFRKEVALPVSGNAREQMLQFLLAGAEAMPWRGITRSSVLPVIDYFPTDDFLGYAVESEYVMSLLGQGIAIHEPSCLYFKRMFPPAARTASRDRRSLDRSTRALGWQQYANRMQAQLAFQYPLTPPVLVLAMQAAMLRRRQFNLGNLLPADLLVSTHEYLTDAQDETVPDAVTSRFELLLSRHAHAEQDFITAVKHADNATGLDPDAAEAYMWRAKLHLDQNEPYAAVSLLEQAGRISPNGSGQEDMRYRISAMLQKGIC